MSTSLAATLYDERLDNNQRRVISHFMQSETPIVEARITDNRLFAFLSNGKGIRIDPNGITWELS